MESARVVVFVRRIIPSRRSRPCKSWVVYHERAETPDDAYSYSYATILTINLIERKMQRRFL